MDTTKNKAKKNAMQAQMKKQQKAAPPKSPAKKNPDTVNAGKSQTKINADNAQKQSQTLTGYRKLLKRVAKIDSLPKTVRESIPLRSFISDGIIETYPGTFTKTYELNDVNFNIAPDEEQLSIFKKHLDFLNSFDKSTKWQFTIFNHEVDKKKTIENLRIPPQKDGLNKYRQEMNGILLQNLKKGNNSIVQDKLLTISIEDDNVIHAVTTLNHMDSEISKRLRKICKSDTKPLSTVDRMRLLYNIYNQNFDYRLATGIYNGKEKFNLGFLEKCGLSVKDVIGPPSFDFAVRGGKYAMVGDKYACAMCLEHTSDHLSTSYLSDLADIQCNMLISVSGELIDREDAIKMVRSRLASIEAQASKTTSRNSEDGYFGSLPPELEQAQENARELMNDIIKRDQNLFFVTVVVVPFADSEEELEENISMIKSVGAKHSAPLMNLKYQQEFALNTALPLCRNDLMMEQLYTSESTGVFIPYNSQEINQKDAIFYGLNQTTKNMVLCNRLTGDNYNGLIFGFSGSGKSFTAKTEIISVLLNHANAQVFVIDPQGEYYPLTRAFNGQEIKLSPGSNSYINPLDMDISTDGDDDNDPVTIKSDFVRSMMDIIIGRGRELDPIHTSIIDKSVRKIYKAYIQDLESTGKTCDITKCPTLSNLYQEWMMLSSEQYEAKQLADILQQYAVGSFDTFAHRTNVETNKRLIVYNTKKLGTGMKELGLHICTSDILNRMISNAKKHIYTWFYIDEFHVLLESPSTTLFLKRIWKMARKWMGVPTGIMQNTEDLLRDADTRAIINNTSFVIMLREPLMDRQNLAELFHLSNSQLEYITDSDPGHGLIYNGKVTIPFGLEFPEDTDLYRIMSTKPVDTKIAP